MGAIYIRPSFLPSARAPRQIQRAQWSAVTVTYVSPRSLPLLSRLWADVSLYFYRLHGRRHRRRCPYRRRASQTDRPSATPSSNLRRLLAGHYCGPSFSSSSSFSSWSPLPPRAPPFRSHSHSNYNLFQGRQGGQSNPADANARAPRKLSPAYPLWSRDRCQASHWRLERIRNRAAGSFAVADEPSGHCPCGARALRRRDQFTGHCLRTSRKGG